MNSTISFPFMNNGVWSRMFFLLFSPIQTKICLLRRKITSVFQRIAFYLENNSLKCTSPYEASYIPQSKEITTADARLKEEAAFLLDTYGNRILGRKESTIRSDLRRGREQLKITLKEVYDFA